VCVQIYLSRPNDWINAWKLCCKLQGGPAKVRPTYIFDGNIW